MFRKFAPEVAEVPKTAPPTITLDVPLNAAPLIVTEETRAVAVAAFPLVLDVMVLERAMFLAAEPSKVEPEVKARPPDTVSAFASVELPPDTAYPSEFHAIAVPPDLRPILYLPVSVS
jgi:hypothetical protein